MHSTQKLIPISIFFLSSLSLAQGKLDTAFLGANKAAPSPSPSSKQTPKAKGGNRSKTIALDEPAPTQAVATSTQQLNQHVETINSLTLLLKTAPQGVARNRLLLNRATALNLYAREKILAQKSAIPTEEIKKYLNASLKDVTEVLASTTATQDQKWRSHDLAGTSSIYLDQPANARMHFLEVLKLNPPAEKAGRIGFMIAEDLFEEQKFPEATKYYTDYFSRMNARLKELAIYKLGWCMINQNDFDKAEAYLVKVAKVKSNSGVGKDAIRDLAYLATNRGNSEASIKRIEANLAAQEDKTAFLYDVVNSLEAQGAISLHTQIVNKLLAIETNLEKRLELALAGVRVQRVFFASKAHMVSFERMIDALDKFDDKTFPATFSKYETPLENETQTIMRAHVDTYAGRVKSPEPYTKPLLGEALKKQFEFYHKHFSVKPAYIPMIAIWRDICLDLKDWQCIDRVSEIIITNPTKLGIYSEKAYLDQIAALDQFVTQPKQNEHDVKAWLTRKDLRVREFIQKFPKSPHWIQIAKFYTQTEMNQGREKVALPILEQIMTSEPNEDNFYNLQYARFKLRDYSTLLKDERGKPYIEKQAKVVELYRESCLILAQQSKDARDVNKYRFYVNNFVALSSDPAKARIARIDFFQFEIFRNMVIDAVNEFYALPPSEYKHADYEEFRVDLWKATVSKGMFDQSLRVSTASEPVSKKPEEWLQRKVLSQIFLGQNPAATDFNLLTNTDREYFLSLAALTKPLFVVDYFKKKKPSNESERNILEIAYKIHLDQWRLVRSPELESIFGKNYPFYDKATNVLLPVEKLIQNIQFPVLSKLNPKRQANAVQEAISKVREAREKVIKAISNQPAEVQKRTLESARDTENKMADYLVNSPIPAELKEPQQIEEYKAGLKSAADEFSQQSSQFEVLAAKIREDLQKDAAKMEARTLPAPPMDRWIWPTGAQKHSQLKWVFELSNAKNSFGALALLDYFKATVVKSDEAYFSIRSGLLLAHSPPQALRLYLLDELERNKKFVVLRNWATIVKRPVPESES